MYINIPFIKLYISITVYNTITIKSLVYTTEMHNTALRLERDHRNEFSISNSFASNPSTEHLTSKWVLSDVQGEEASAREGGNSTTAILLSK